MLKGSAALNNKDYTQAMSWFRTAADQGNVDAQVAIGLLYEKGWGVTQDDTQALTWYQKAASQGNTGAQYKIGQLSGHNEQSVEISPGEALQKGTWAFENGDFGQTITSIRKAAYQGNSDAQYKLGVFYRNGWGVGQDYAQAMTWFRAAADHGNSDAQYDIGVLYQNGWGCPSNLTEARRWMAKAAAGGNANAKSWLALH